MSTAEKIAEALGVEEARFEADGEITVRTFANFRSLTFSEIFTLPEKMKELGHEF